jgi:hypothetical protein
MKTLIETDEVAKDVAGAEMLIERHQEHKVIITKRSKIFCNFTLVKKRHKRAFFCFARIIMLVVSVVLTWNILMT